MATLKDASGNDYTGALRDQVGTGAITDARTASGVLNAVNAEIVMDLDGKGVALYEIRTAANSATYVFEVSLDGTNYIAADAYVVGGLLAAVVQPARQFVASVVVASTAAAVYRVDCAGWRKVRCRVSAFTSGTATVTGRASMSQQGIVAEVRPSNLHVTATAAVNTASTLTLPAAGAGTFHHISKIELVKLYNVVGVAAGAGNIITSTNLPGSPAWTTEQLASAAGACVTVIDYEYGANPLKSLVANTATTFVAPLQLQTIWRWNVSYFVGP